MSVENFTKLETYKGIKRKYVGGNRRHRCKICNSELKEFCPECLKDLVDRVSK